MPVPGIVSLRKWQDIGCLAFEMDEKNRENVSEVWKSVYIAQFTFQCLV
jgi:hypothetical protein